MTPTVIWMERTFQLDVVPVDAQLNSCPIITCENVDFTGAGDDLLELWNELRLTSLCVPKQRCKSENFFRGFYDDACNCNDAGLCGRNIFDRLYRRRNSSAVES